MREKPQIVSGNTGTYLHKRTVHFYVSLPENVRFSIGKRRKCGESILSLSGGFRVFS